MALENSMLVIDGNQIGGRTEDMTAYQTKSDNNLQTTDKTVVGGINELKSSVNEKANLTLFASAFDRSKAIDEGTYVIYDNKIYKCKTWHYGQWDSNDFIEKEDILSIIKPSQSQQVTPVTNKTTVNEVEMCRCGDVISMSLVLKVTGSISAWGLVATLPDGYRPIINYNTIGLSDSGETLFRISTDGMIVTNKAVSSGSLYISATYMVRK